MASTSHTTYKQIRSGTLENRPLPGNVDTYYLDTSNTLYHDNGEAWEIVSPAEAPTPVGAPYNIIWGLFCLGEHFVLYPAINMIYAIPILIPYPLTISHICLPILNQSGNVKAAIYDDNGTVPGASPAGASRLAITASEAVAEGYTRMDIALETPLSFSTPGLNWLAVKCDDDAAGLTRGLPTWSTASGSTTPVWAPNAYQVDPEGSYEDLMPETFPDNPTIERAVGIGILGQRIP